MIRALKASILVVTAAAIAAAVVTYNPLAIGFCAGFALRSFLDA